VSVRNTAMETDVRLDCGSAQMPVQDCLRRLKLDAFDVVGLLMALIGLALVVGVTLTM